jgi:hypothetical protein
MSFADHLDILFEDNHCLALNKPAGWPTTHFDGKDETVDRLVKAYLKEKYDKPGNVFLGVVHRLDKPVSGSLLFARTGKSASRLSEQFREGMVEKVYWAIVENQLSGERKPPVAPWATQDAGSLEDWLKKDEPNTRVEVVEPETEGAQFAISGEGATRRLNMAGTTPAHRAQASVACATGQSRMPDLWRHQVRQRLFIRPRDRAACTEPHVPAPDDEGTD